MKKDNKEILSTVDNMIQGLELEEGLKQNLELVNNNEDYYIVTDILHRSRELAVLYLKIKNRQRAIDILRITIDFSYEIKEIALDDIAKDVELVIKLYKQQNGKKHIAKLLETMIERYPDYTCISKWEKQLEKYQTKTNE